MVIRRQPHHHRRRRRRRRISRHSQNDDGAGGPKKNNSGTAATANIAADAAADEVTTPVLRAALSLSLSSSASLSRGSSRLWRPVRVGLDDDDDHKNNAGVGGHDHQGHHHDDDDDDDDDDDASYAATSTADEQQHVGRNHYDHPQLARRAKHDLEGLPEEGVGIFLGLQVLDGSCYHVVPSENGDGSKRIVYYEDAPKQAHHQPAPNQKQTQVPTQKQAQPTTAVTNNNNGNNNKSLTNNHKDDSVASLTDDDVVANDETNNKKKKNKKQSEKRKQKKMAKKELKKINKEEDNVSPSKKEKISIEHENDDDDDCDDDHLRKSKRPRLSDPPSSFSHDKDEHVDDDASENESNDDDDDKADGHDHQQQEVDATAETAATLSQIQQDWMVATGGFMWSASASPILSTLARYQWHYPTPIQATTLAAACLGRRNIVGAAPTGSGKTLAYLLPILQDLYDNKYPTTPETSTLMFDHGNKKKVLQALILTPTRELALQVGQECNKFPVPARHDDKTKKLFKMWCTTLVGGLAIAKQARILSSSHPPPILVATPGRLWELISSREHAYLNDLSQVRFLVIDEADRMIQQGSFPQLVKILDAIHKANPMHDDDDHDDEGDDADEGGMGDPRRLASLPGIPGEAKVQMLNEELLQQLQRQEQQQQQPETLQDDEQEKEEEEEEDSGSDNDEEAKEAHPQPMELDDEEYERMRLEQEALLDATMQADDAIITLPVPPPVRRQTFIFSATLTLPPTSGGAASRTSSSNKKSSKKGSGSIATVEGAIAELLEKARAKGPTKIVDLTTTTSSKSSRATTSDSAANSKPKLTDSTLPSSRLPPGLTLEQISCTQKHKDSHLYAYLVTTAQGTAGPALVFCNSIVAVRRVGATLETLGLNVRILHAHLQQKARFKAVESLRQPKCRTIVVATDVAARGLDIPAVATVIHYDVPRAVDTFVHRAGRTARGVGDGAIGSSLSLVSPAEDKTHSNISQALGASFSMVRLDGRLLSSAQERTNLASKIVNAEQVQNRAQKSNQWFVEKAEEAGLELDDTLLEEGLAGGDERERHQLREANKAKLMLRQLLSQPMQTQRFGKFLSRNSAAKVPQPDLGHVVPLKHKIPGPKTNAKRKRRK